MDLRPRGVPWDREYWRRIERKGGAHYRAPCSDYIDVERKIAANELRYADRVEVYVSGSKFMDTVVVLNGGVYMSTGIKDEAEGVATEQERYDSVSVTGSGRQVEEDEDPTDINPNRPSGEVERVKFDAQRVGDFWREPSPDLADLERRIAADTVGDGDLVFIEEPVRVANILPDQKYMITPAANASSSIDYDLCERLGLTVEQCEEWRPGAGWSDPKPITGDELRHSALYWLAQADKRRREARVWAGVAGVALLLIVAVLFIPNGWIYHLFEAFK